MSGTGSISRSWVCLIAIAAVVCLHGCEKRPQRGAPGAAGESPPRRPLRPEALPAPPPVAGDKVYVWFLRADLLAQPTETSSEVLGVVGLGSTLNVRGVRGEWALVQALKVGVESDRGWIHLSQITRNAKDVAAVRRTGLVPRAALILRGIQSTSEMKAVMIGGDLGVVKKRDTQGQIERVALAEGQCIWLADSPDLRRMRSVSLERIGLGHIEEPRGNTLYWMNPDGAIRSFRERLAFALDSPPSATAGCLGFQTTDAMFPDPIDVWWLPTGDADEQGVVLDRRRGTVFVRVHPIRGVEEVGRVEREGCSPQVVGVFRGMLVVGYAGSGSELVFYEISQKGEWKEKLSQVVPSPVTAMLPGPKHLYIGMADGRILSVNAEGRWIKGVSLGTGPVRRIEAYGKGLAVACGKGGMRFVEVVKPGHFGERAVKAEEWGPVDTFVFLDEAKRKRVIVLSKEEGVRLLPMSKRGEVSTLIEPDAKPCSIITGAPQGGVVMSAPTGERRLLVVGMGAGGIRVLDGENVESLKVSRELPLPCDRLAMGREFLGMVGGGKVFFVSLSEILPAENTWERYVVHADAKMSVVGKRIFVQSATCHGFFLVRESVAEACRRGARLAAGPAASGITVMERPQGILCTGSGWIRDARVLAFRPNARVTVGRGGATLWGERRKAGDVFLMDEFGLPIYIGGWGGVF